MSALSLTVFFLIVYALYCKKIYTSLASVLTKPGESYTSKLHGKS